MSNSRSPIELTILSVKPQNSHVLPSMGLFKYLYVDHAASHVYVKKRYIYIYTRCINDIEYINFEYHKQYYQNVYFLSLSLSLSLTHTHTHTHIYIHAHISHTFIKPLIYLLFFNHNSKKFLSKHIYMCVCRHARACVCVCARTRVLKVKIKILG